MQRCSNCTPYFEGTRKGRQLKHGGALTLCQVGQQELHRHVLQVVLKGAPLLPSAAPLNPPNVLSRLLKPCSTRASEALWSDAPLIVTSRQQVVPTAAKDVLNSGSVL